MFRINQTYLGNALAVLKTFPDDSIDCCVTSPPYFGLRDYGTAKWIGGDPDCNHIFITKGDIDSRFPNRIFSSHALRYNKQVCKKCGAIRCDEQIGLENSPEEFIEHLTEIFKEVYRVLKPEGTLWINIGDSYNGYKSNANSESFESEYAGHRQQYAREPRFGLQDKSLKDKDLIGIPWMLAFSLRASGWYLRQDIIWSKPNPMPESVTDRCTKSHEYIFLLSKSKKYYFDSEAIREPVTSNKGNTRSFRGGNAYTHGQSFQNPAPTERETHDNIENTSGLRNKRSVWSIAPSKSQYPHYATFPERLIVPCILAGSPEGGGSPRPFHGNGNYRTGRPQTRKKLRGNRTQSHLSGDSRKKNQRRRSKSFQPRKNILTQFLPNGNPPGRNFYITFLHVFPKDYPRRHRSCRRRHPTSRMG